MNSIFSKKALSKEFLANEAFKKSKTAQAIKWVARPDGFSQYWQLSEDIEIPPGGAIELEVMYSSESVASDDYILTSEGSSSTSMFLSFNSQLSVGSSGIISSFTVDGVETNNLPYDDKFHKIVCNVPSANGRVGILGARFNFVRTIDAAIRSFIIKDSLGVTTNEILLTNKAQGAMQLATVGDVNAFMPNYSSDVWEVDNSAS